MERPPEQWVWRQYCELHEDECVEKKELFESYYVWMRVKKWADHCDILELWAALNRERYKRKLEVMRKLEDAKDDAKDEETKQIKFEDPTKKDFEKMTYDDVCDLVSDTVVSEKLWRKLRSLPRCRFLEGKKYCMRDY